MSETIPTVEQFIAQIDAEEAKSTAKGYTPEHDRERGADHLLNWAIEYARLGKPAASANLIRTARRVLKEELAESQRINNMLTMAARELSCNCECAS